MGHKCNLAKQHSRCPTSSPERCAHCDKSRGRLTDGLVAHVAEVAYRDLGFRGFTCFHYYNEPMLNFQRLVALTRRIRGLVPEAKFGLWTNGTIEPVPWEDMRSFDRVWVSIYGNKSRNFARRAAEYVDSVMRRTGILDSRMQHRSPSIPKSCWRPHNEMVVCSWGTVHLCCMDWRGEARMGPVHTDEELRMAVAKFAAIQEALENPANCEVELIPRCCYTCMRPTRQPSEGLR